MKFTAACDYAVRALAHLAAAKDNPVVASQHIAQARGIPERFLLKVLRPLVAARILYSLKGPNGGYRLAKAPKEITLLEIIEAVDGPIQSQGDFAGSKGNRVGKKLQAAWDQANAEIRRQLGKVRLSDLAGNV